MNKVKFYKIYAVDADGKLWSTFEYDLSATAYEVGYTYFVGPENLLWRKNVHLTEEECIEWKRIYGHMCLDRICKCEERGYFGAKTIGQVYQSILDYIGVPNRMSDFDRDDWYEFLDAGTGDSWPFSKDLVIVECEGIPLYRGNLPARCKRKPTFHYLDYSEYWFEEGLPHPDSVLDEKTWWENFNRPFEEGLCESYKPCSAEFYSMKVLRIVEHMQVEKMLSAIVARCKDRESK